MWKIILVMMTIICGMGVLGFAMQLSTKKGRICFIIYIILTLMGIFSIIVEFKIS